MINLLPPQQKKELASQKNFRLILIMGLLFLFFLACLSSSLWTVEKYMAVKLQEKDALFREKESVIAANQNVEQKINEANRLLSDLRSFYQELIYISPILDKLNGLLPQGSYLINFSFNFARPKAGGDEQVGHISLSGYSPSRNQLLELQKRLEEAGDFLAVTFSPTSWVQPTDVEFSVSFDLEKD
ncbi:MAG: hypothetical protein GF370_04690 [Candidatus Nealsonbacteria bacterium]|nr:hypothetical protein [Candidatus Nealsonbacteria bacterium]